MNPTLTLLIDTEESKNKAGYRNKGEKRKKK